MDTVANDKTASLIAPAASGERYTEIDALRGFALFGILLANLPVWVGLPFAGPRAPNLMGTVSPAVFGAFFNGVLDGKFYTIFSLLFGLGFTLQLERLEARGAAGTRIFLRRMAVLLVFGLVHLSFIWSGDILMLYALMGFTLPLFRHLSDRALLVAAALLLFVLPPLLVRFVNDADPGFEGGLFGWAVGIYQASGGTGTMETYFDELATGGWRDWWQRAQSEWAFGIVGRIADWRFLKVLGTMLLGMWAGRMLLRGALLENRRLLWTTLVAGLAVGAPLNVIYAGLPPHSQTHWSSLFGTAPLGLAYAAAFLLAIPHLPRLRRALADAGRMALTNYITTSVVMGLLFYGIGFGMMGTLHIPETYAIGFAFFAAMLAWSRWWLARHRQGPLEWLWRKLTYGAPLKARTPVAATG